jgi:hypothetical protein
MTKHAHRENSTRKQETTQRGKIVHLRLIFFKQSQRMLYQRLELAAVRSRGARNVSKLRPADGFAARASGCRQRRVFVDEAAQRFDDL